MLWDTEEIGRVLGSQIYVYNSPEEIPSDPPRGVNDVFIDINLGKVYQWDGTEWKYKFPIPNDSRIADIVDELTALGASLSDAESARVVAENARVGAEQSRVAAETARETAEATRQSNETARQGAESTRASAETSRDDAESLREEAEDARQTAEGQRAGAEATRQSQESTRQSNEAARGVAETARATAEGSRANAESARAIAEGNREAAESARASAEKPRASAEAARQANESARQSQEQARQSQESARQTNETSRQSAEATRNQNEASRQVAESNRADAEGLRAQAENARAANDATWNGNEQARQTNESARVLAEKARVDAETRRQAELDSKITYGSNWYDGTGGAGYADVADNLNATKGLTVNDDPMSFGIVGGAQKSAVGDGNASISKLTCVDVVRNQLVHMETSFPTQVEIAESLTKFTVLAADTETYVRPSVSFTNGHIYFVVLNVSGTFAALTYWLNGAYEQSIDLKSAAMQLLNYTRSNGTGGQLVVNGSAGATASLYIIDLTQRYGNNEVVNAIIGTTTSEQVARLLAFDPEILSDTAHDAGTLVPSKSAKLVSKGKDGKVLETIALPNHEGHGILKVVDGKVVADGDELYPDGNSKKRYAKYTFTGNEGWTYRGDSAKGWSLSIRNSSIARSKPLNTHIVTDVPLTVPVAENVYASNGFLMGSDATFTYFYFTDMANFPSTRNPRELFTAGKVIYYEMNEAEDISTPVYQSTFPVEQGGTLQFLDESDKPIAGLQGSEIFYQKNIKAFVEALGEATDWNPERIKRLGSLSFTPEYVSITLNPSPTGAYARAQVYNATFTIVISAPLTGTANGSITFQDSEVDLSNFQTKPAEAIYDMDGKKVSEEPTTADCNIASFVGRSKGGTIMWSLLHSGVNKVKIHIEEAVPLDSDGKGKIDCRASLIL